MRSSSLLKAFVPLAGVLALLTAGEPVDAACTYGGCPDWPSDCYNLKSVRWCAGSNGISSVSVQNHGSYEGALDWARTELSTPHNGIGNSLSLPQVSSGGQIDVYDYTGSADWWGLADSYKVRDGTNCLTGVRVQINKSYMSSYIRKQYTMLHELGHATGLNHVCVCPRTMNPCGTCGDDANGDTPYLKKCDAQGLQQRYHCKSSQELCGNKCCSAPSNATPTCSSGSCGFTCNSGYFKCGGVSCCGSGQKCCPSGACVTSGGLCPL